MFTPAEFGKYSIGIGDRFGRQGQAQLRALARAAQDGVAVTPVWNKSFREHTIIGSTPAGTRRAVEEAVKGAGWKGSYFADADHINLKNVEGFLPYCDFYTIDVADDIGKPADPADVATYIAGVKKYCGQLQIPGISEPIGVAEEDLRRIAAKYLRAIKEAGKIYRRIAEAKGGTPFVPEISTDEATDPQTPVELFFILAAIAQEGIPVETIAPKFTGAFLKGIDYVGRPEVFAREFEEDLHVIAFAVKQFGLPPRLKISVHSGSDKFTLYPIIRNAIRKLGSGLHLKTAGTTWLEEVIGLAAAGGDGLEIAKRVYRRAHENVEELCKPYATVIAIDRDRLPAPAVVDSWNAVEFTSALRHDPADPRYNLHLRQLVHVGYRVAAEMGEEFLRALDRHRATVGENVYENLWERHIRPLFVGPA